MLYKMVSKNGFIPNVRRQNLPRAAKMFKNTPLNGPNGLNVMFNASQIPDNPGYMDFSNPTPPIAAPNSGINKKMPHTGGGRPQRNIMPQRNIGEPHAHRNNWMGGRNGRGPPPMRSNHPKFSGRGGNRQFNGVDMPRRPMPPIPPMPMRGPMPPIPIEPMSNRFNAMPPMMRNNMAGIRPGPGPPMPPIPPQMMRRTRNAPLPPPPPMRRPNNAIPPSPRVMKQHKRNGKPIKFSNPVHRSDVPSKKTLKEIVNQYPLDKPWVTAEIRQEHAKKEDIENRLKGKKNDALFAEFKIQRDKFVALYESARDKHLEAAKSKDNQTDADKKNAEKQK